MNASRPTTYEAHPTAGMPILVEDWPQFLILYNQLLQTHSIQSMKDVWWDLRPSPGYGTLEIEFVMRPPRFLKLKALLPLSIYWHFIAKRTQKTKE